MTHYLFDRPGFQQDPVADTADDTIIGAHCPFPTRPKRSRQPPEPFQNNHHPRKSPPAPQSARAHGRERDQHAQNDAQDHGLHRRSQRAEAANPGGEEIDDPLAEEAPDTA